jgi:hypothetical protein
MLLPGSQARALSEVRQLNSLLAYEVRCRIVRGLHKGSNVTRARLSRSPKHHPSSLLVSLAICVLNAEYSLQIPNTYPDALFVRFARQFGDWLHLKGPRLVKRCQARSIDHLHAPTACLHLVVKQDCAALRNAFVFSLASGCPVARLFGVDQKSTRVVAADVSYVITHRQLHRRQLPSQLQFGQSW